IGRAPSELSMVSVTSARPSAGRPAVPAKMTSSIFPPRSAFAPCSPSTQLIASTTLDLPDPFGPTTQVMPGSRRSVVAEAKDLKPFSVRLLRCTGLQSAAEHRSLPAGPRPTRRPSGLHEAAQIAARVGPLLGDPVHPTGRAGAAQRLQQPRARRPRALGDHRDPAVGQVARRADQPQLERPGAGPPPETDPLHAAADPGDEPHRALVVVHGPRTVPESVRAGG